MARSVAERVGQDTKTQFLVVPATSGDKALSGNVPTLCLKVRNFFLLENSCAVSPSGMQDA